MSSYSSSKNFSNGYPTPGPQNPSGSDVLNHIFFSSKAEWHRIREEYQFDFVVIGTGFCALAFIERALKNNPFSRILVLEKGEYFLPEHFQNLPLTFKNTLGGLSETFPWTLGKKTAEGYPIKFQFGIVPFFGGRSTVWSGWCPRPTKEEMVHWPAEVIETCSQYYGDAEKLLNVVPADQINSLDKSQPAYGELQKTIQSLLEENANAVSGITRVMAAPMAVKNPDQDDIDFSKFSVPGELLEIIERQKLFESQNRGSSLKVVTDCTVEKILQEDGTAIGLQTSRGILNIAGAKVIVATGTLPATTLMRNSFPNIPGIGTRFTSHFISSIVARVHKSAFNFSKHLATLELGAFYVAGVDPTLKYDGQFHIQLTSLYDTNPTRNAVKALRNMPDVVATATLDQLVSSEEYVVFVCAVLGELDWRNKNNSFLGNNDSDITVNSTLQCVANDNDMKVWDSMEDSTFRILEQVIAKENIVEYWHNSAATWQVNRPQPAEIRVPGLVHDASTMWIGKEGVVDLDYRPRGVKNVYITGGALWPTGASWNPTLTMVAMAQHLADSLCIPVPNRRLENLFVNFSDSDIAKASDVLRSQTISGDAPHVHAFEMEIARYFNKEQAVAVCSGTISIYCALRALGVGPGDEVILNPTSVIMSALPVTDLGATVRFADNDAGHFGFELTSLKEMISKKTKAVIVVPMWGYPVDIESIVNLCSPLGVAVIEDISQCHGTKWNGRFLGTFGDIGCLSTQERKLITTGEGGVVLTDRKDVAEKIEVLKRYGLDANGNIGLQKGLNLKMSALAANAGITQLRKLSSKIYERKRVAQQIREGIKSNNWFEEVSYPIHSSQNYYALAFLITDHRYSTKLLGQYLSTHEIISDPWRYDYKPLYEYPLYSKNGNFPNAEAIIESVFTLPCHEGMVAEDIAKVINAINEFKVTE